jgi:hypothetical protein
MTLDLTLIGTHHFDIDGNRKLYTYLEMLQPEEICIESGKTSYLENLKEFRFVRNKNKLSKALILSEDPDYNIDTIYEVQHNIGYELVVSYEYAQKHALRFDACDHPDALKSMDISKELSKMKEYFKLSPAQVRAKVEELYRTEPVALEATPEYFVTLVRRDEFVEQQLRQKTGKVVYVGGLGHFFGDYHPNLYDRLSDLNPKRLKLV